MLRTSKFAKLVVQQDYYSTCFGTGNVLCFCPSRDNELLKGRLEMIMAIACPINSQFCPRPVSLVSPVQSAFEYAPICVISPRQSWKMTFFVAWKYCKLCFSAFLSVSAEPVTCNQNLLIFLTIPGLVFTAGYNEVPVTRLYVEAFSCFSKIESVKGLEGVCIVVLSGLQFIKLAFVRI